MKTNKKSIRADYLSGKADLKDFYQYPIQETDFKQIIKDKSKEQIDREALYQALTDQYEGINVSPQTQKNIESLRSDNTFTFTTGHQLVLFGGPLYTIYKVLTVIKLAEILRAELPDYQFVPVFWIHTEDHDFEEINHYYTSFQSRHTYPSSFEGMVGDHILTQEIQSLFPDNFPDNLKTAYQTGKKMSRAYFEFMNEIFKDFGLVILDANHPALKRQFIRVLEDELTQQSSFDQVNKTSAQLEASGYPLQITPREINLFYSADHLRNRIVEESGKFHVIDTDISFEANELLAQIKTKPEHFSPNVVLRPLYQEMILPNLAYTGGWGELSYWLQLRGVFEHHKVNFPLLLPRMSATVFTKDVLNSWEQLGFAKEDIHQPIHQLNKKYIPNIWDNGTFLEHSQQLIDAYEAMATYIEGISTTMVRSVKGQETKANKFLKNLEKKIHRVIRHNHRDPFMQIAEIKSQIQADPLVQERIWSLAALNDMLPEEFVRLAWENCQPLQMEHRYLVVK